MESIAGSLKRLQTDYVDLYQAHRFDYETPLEETMQAFGDLVRMGKVLYVGVSEWNAEQIREGQALASQMGYRLISNQPQYSMLWRVIEEKVVPTSQELGLSQIVWSPLAQGVLTGKYLPGAELPADSRAANSEIGGFMEKFLGDDLLTKIQKLLPLAEQLELRLAQFSIAWVLQNKNIAAAIVGASKPEQIASNIKASGVEIPAELMKQADEILGDSIVRDPELTKSPETRP
jgi:aryl-alcohol dehydrogenase-like predicted oxidoreductase